jgi:hypothetical protein
MMMKQKKMKKEGENVDEKGKEKNEKEEMIINLDLMT